MTERLCVCGLGKVGRPIFDMLQRKGFKAIGYDYNPEKSNVTIEEAVGKSDACIFIVQTPSLPEGNFSNDHLWAAIKLFYIEVTRQRKENYLYIVTSTTTPGSCNEFMELVGKQIVYKPEFIRLEFVREDLIAPSFILIGEGCGAAGFRAERIYKAIADVPVKRMSLIEAELAKITLNCALTMKISLANQLHLVAEKLGASSKRIMDAVGTDPRIGNQYLNPGAPYGGPCLPRDGRMFGYVAQKVGVKPSMSIAADEINQRIYEELAKEK